MKRLFVIFLIFFVLLFFEKPAIAQQDVKFSHYMFSTMSYNPGYTGVEGFTKLTLMYRSNWSGYRSDYDGRVHQGGSYFSLNAPLLRANSGAGFYVLNDQVGFLNTLELQGSYAYHLKVKDYKVSFGLQLGIVTKSFDKSKYKVIHPGEPLLKSGESQTRPDMSAGLYLQGEKLFAGLSYRHLLDTEFDWGLNGFDSKLVPQYFLIGGYHITFMYDFVLTPSFYFTTDLDHYTFNVSALLEYKQQMWGGVAYRDSEGVSLLVGYSFLKDKSLKFGYSLDYVFFGQNAKAPTSHELMLSYKLPMGTAKNKKIIRTPRFRLN
ncbi:MAG: type IX secretion system membrane protein PorP/SprF [Cytophagales bacterium]|nr:type IX secretion system membrane protein PorP/SprF [Cytophagales bacterium]